jgi:hypothetical protein
MMRCRYGGRQRSHFLLFVTTFFICLRELTLELSLCDGDLTGADCSVQGHADGAPEDARLSCVPRQRRGSHERKTVNC